MKALYYEIPMQRSKRFNKLRNVLRHLRISRFFGFVAAFLVGLFLLIAIPALSQRTITLTFLMNAPETPFWRPIVKEFEAENPGIRINIVEGPNASNLVEDLYTSAFLLGDSPYDLVYMDVVWVPKFAAAGWLRPLDERVSQETLSQFLEGDVEGGRYNEQLYRMPFRTDAGMLYYRTDLLEQGGYQPPELFSELMQVSQSLKQNTDVPWGYLWQGRQYEGTAAMFVEVLKGFGGYWINPDTREVGLDRPEAVQSVQFLLSTIRQGISPQGVTTYQEEEARRLFQSGGAVFMRNWPYAWPLVNAPDSPVRGKVAIKPMVHAPGEESAACLGGWGWGISSTTRHPDAAWKAIEFFSQLPVQRKYILETGYLPSRKSLYNDPPIVQKYAFFPDMLEVLENTTLRPPIAQYAQASDILQRYLSAALSGRTSPEQAMRSAADETRRLLGRV